MALPSKTTEWRTQASSLTQSRILVRAFLIRKMLITLILANKVRSQLHHTTSSQVTLLKVTTEEK